MRRLYFTFIALLVVAVPCLGAEPSGGPSDAAKWGAQTLEQIRSAFYMPDRKLYAEEINNGKKPAPSWIWDASIQLGALDAAAKVQPKTYLPQVKAYAAALRAYRTTNHDRPGLDVNPPPKKPDRYYDDNAWIAMSLLDAYDLTHDQKDLDLALDAYKFAISGEDFTTLDGGIYWHEDVTRSKNACSSGPVMIDALQLCQLTKDQKYLETAKRLYDWQRAHLQDTDGLVFDSIATANGRINRAKLTYNSGTLIRASCLLYQATHEQKYLDEAQRIAHAAEKRFVRPADGIITGWGKLGVKLVEAFLDLYETDHDDHWRQVVGRCLAALHQHRNAEGWYPLNWEADPPAADKPVRLIDQSAPARAYWIAAEHGVQVHQ
jgi:uncharacterized protein YyaL (SSP411 family)